MQSIENRHGQRKPDYLTRSSFVSIKEFKKKEKEEKTGGFYMIRIFMG